MSNRPALLAALLLSSLPALLAAAPGAGAARWLALEPVCSQPSHDHLEIRVERDVCAPSRSASGAPRASGLLPTACADPRGVMALDVLDQRDLCLSPLPAGQRPPP